MKYQSIIIEGRSIDLENTKQILKNKLNISEQIKDLNIRKISKPEDKESIGIKEVNELSEWAYRKSDELRLLIIENAEVLTEQAQNSLLKLIEEPPENNLIALTVSNINSILTTILSRCLIVESQSLDTYTVNDKDIVNFMQANYLERSRIIDKMFSENIKRAEASEFIEAILRHKLKYVDTKNTDEIENVYRGVKRGVNLKLCLDYLNILLE